MARIELEIRRKELIQVTENIVEALLCDLTQDGKYSPRVIREMTERLGEYDIYHADLADFLSPLADKIERLARENMECTCAPDSNEVCTTCKLLS